MLVTNQGVAVAPANPIAIPTSVQAKHFWSKWTSVQGQLRRRRPKHVSFTHKLVLWQIFQHENERFGSDYNFSLFSKKVFEKNHFKWTVKSQV